MFRKPPLPSREAHPASDAWNVVKTSAQMVGFWAVFLFVFPPLIVRAEKALAWEASALQREWLCVIGAVMFGSMSLLGVFSAWVMARHGAGTPLPFDCPRRLVVRGPYRYVRNPMAIAGLGQALGIGLYLGSWGVLAYVACGFVVWNYLVRVWEEDDLLERFGEAYEAYRKSVRCWWPRVTPYVPGEP